MVYLLHAAASTTLPLMKVASMLLSIFFNDIYAKVKGVSPRTKQIYGHTFNQFDRYLERPAMVVDLTDVNVGGFLSWRRAQTYRGKPVRSTTVLKDRAHLLALSALAFQKRQLEEALVLPPFRAAPRVPRGYTQDDVEKLIRYAQTLPGRVAGVASSWWWSSLFRFLYETGARIGETMALRWDYVELADQRVTLIAETRKLHTRDIERYVSHELASQLQLNINGPSALVWPWDRPANSKYRNLQSICRAAGVVPRGFHSFRKCAASYVAAAAGPAAASELLDHSDTGALFKKHYCDSRIVNNGSRAVDILPTLNVAPFLPQNQG